MKTSDFLASLKWCLTNTSDAAGIAVNALKTQTQLHIITTNMEIMGLAVRKPEIFEVCKHADLHVPDGIGAVKILAKFGYKPQSRITGVELGPEILKQSPPGTKVFLFGSAAGVADFAVANQKKVSPNINFVGTANGYGFHDNDIIEKINLSGAEILYVALGVPKQELWLAKNLPKMPGVKVAIGVGGSFLCWADENNRSPKWVQKLGLEWAHRILREPFVRIPRFWNTLRNFLPMYYWGK
jgi:N-acetylglucosaminyldiphosphoundecaprenol N-acetyl-beta-D-mannosaminyltransferase